VEGISGACLLIRREVFEHVGGFSEDYFMYGEDMDLCLKVRRAGWKNYYVPEAELVHYGGGSSKQSASNFSAVMMRESIWRFLRKHRGGLYGQAYRCAMLLAASCRLGLLGLWFP
jgi:GT2 family glycosyltransferase